VARWVADSILMVLVGLLLVVQDSWKSWMRKAVRGGIGVGGSKEKRWEDYGMERPVEF
jgi:hypothetical protein